MASFVTLALADERVGEVMVGSEAVMPNRQTTEPAKTT
jgi:hypothetical protein